ncbi:MAG: S8 family serine peptidase, partial [Anaerolineae bacterium]
MRPGQNPIRPIVFVLLLTLAFAGWPHAGSAGPAGPAAAGAAEFVPGEVVIAWEPAAEDRTPAKPGQPGVDRSDPAWQQAAARLAARVGLPVLDLVPEHGIARLAVPPGQEMAAIARLTALPWVAHAGLNRIARAAGYPADPRIGEQWHMRRIAAPAAWDLTFGSYSLVVAVIDTGVDLSHPEFAGRLLTGYDYVNQDNAPNDDNGHGTHVAGIIAAAANNGIGVAGLAANVKLLPLKVLDSAGNGNYYDIAAAIYRAADTGAQVINLSLGGLTDDPMWRNAVSYALGKNVFIAAAAGNCAQGGPACLYQTNPDFYPAAIPGVAAVAASDHFDNWAPYSGFKPYIALAAPGGVSGDAVLSTLPGGYGWKYGTSMATAQVSAAAALILTYRPAASPAQVMEILQNTADKVGPYT